MKVSRLLLFLVIVCLQSCTKPVDFDQIDDASFDAVYITTLIHLNLNAPNFLDELNNEISLKSDVIEVPISNSLEPYIEKVEFTIKTENTFDRTFSLNFVFFDAFSSPIYTLKPTINVPGNTTELTTILVIPQEDIGIIYDTEFIGAAIRLFPSDDGSILGMNETSNLNLKSSMKLFVNY